MKRAIMLDRKPLQELLLLDEDSIVAEVLTACLVYDETGAYDGVFSSEIAETAFASFLEGLDSSRIRYDNAVLKAKRKEARKVAKREARKGLVNGKKQEK